MIRQFEAAFVIERIIDDNHLSHITIKQLSERYLRTDGL